MVIILLHIHITFQIWRTCWNSRECRCTYQNCVNCICCFWSGSKQHGCCGTLYNFPLVSAVCEEIKKQVMSLLFKHSNLTMIYLNMHLRLVKSHQMKYELVVVTLDFKEDEWPGFWSYLNNSHHVILLQAHSFLNFFAGQCLWDGRYDRWASGICFAWSCSSAEAWQGLLLPHNISSHQRDI